MKPRGRVSGKLLLGLCIALVGVIHLPRMAGAQIENRPFKTFDVYPKITHGPILLRPTENSVSTLWTTGIACQAAVMYGEGKPEGRVPWTISVIPGPAAGRMWEVGNGSPVPQPLSS
jgi:hypothetical protein